MPKTMLQHSCKAIMIGDSGAGKTSLLLTYKEKGFKEKHPPTVGADFHKIEVTLEKGEHVDFPVADDVSMQINIWDIAG